MTAKCSFLFETVRSRYMFVHQKSTRRTSAVPENLRAGVARQPPSDGHLPRANSMAQTFGMKEDTAITRLDLSAISLRCVSHGKTAMGAILTLHVFCHKSP